MCIPLSSSLVPHLHHHHLLHTLLTIIANKGRALCAAKGTQCLHPVQRGPTRGLPSPPFLGNLPSKRFFKQLASNNYEIVPPHHHHKDRTC